jgi:hypothetical protein
MTVRSGVLGAGLLLVLVQASACTGVKSPVEPSEPRSAEPPPIAQPKPVEPPPPKPAEPPQARTAEPSQPKPPAPPPPRPATPPPPRPTPAPPPRQGAAPPPPLQPAAILDLAALEKRLRDTSAIGLFTKLALKNQVDDLLEQIRAFHEGRGGATLTKLRESYDLLVLKVVSLLQDKDPPLARDIFTSRETLWNLLADPVKFKTLGFAPTRGLAWRRA